MKRFEDVCQDEYTAVLKYLTRLCGDASLGKELTQETFYQAQRSWKHFSGESSVLTWLCGIGKHVYWHTLKKNEPPMDELVDMSAPDFTDQLVEKDRAMNAYHVLHSLPEPYREVFTMRTFCDLNHAQIAELFGKGENWARVTYHRARIMLQSAMKEEQENED